MRTGRRRRRGCGGASRCWWPRLGGCWTTCRTRQSFHTEELRWLVLDEADRLLDLGFEQKIGAVLTPLMSTMLVHMQSQLTVSGRVLAASLGLRLTELPAEHAFLPHRGAALALVHGRGIICPA